MGDNLKQRVHDHEKEHCESIIMSFPHMMTECGEPHMMTEDGDSSAAAAAAAPEENAAAQEESTQPKAHSAFVSPAEKATTKDVLAKAATLSVRIHQTQGTRRSVTHRNGKSKSVELVKGLSIEPGRLYVPEGEAEGEASGKEASSSSLVSPYSAAAKGSGRGIQAELQNNTRKQSNY